MTRLDDTLIQQLATQRAPRAYSHEVKAMAEEILQRRTAERAAVVPPPPPPNPWSGPLGGMYP